MAGDLLVPLKEGVITRSKIYGELADIVSGKIPGRENDEEITIYESAGFAALDMAVAATACHKALALKLGTRPPANAPSLVMDSDHRQVRNGERREWRRSAWSAGDSPFHSVFLCKCEG